MHKIGPNLWNIFNAKKGSKEGYKYSPAMLAKGGVWDEESLFHFTHKPKLYVPGTKMSFVGFSKLEDVANIVAFLKTLKD
jgi:cytochrome c